MAAGALAGAALLVSAAGASAATIDVGTTVDELGEGTGCSLREAVNVANTNADYGGCTRVGTGGADIITVDGGVTYLLTRSGADDANQLGDLDVTGDTTVEVTGPGDATIDGGDLDRVIDVVPATIIPKRRGDEEQPRLAAANLVITNGTVAPGQPIATSQGGGIQVAPDAVLSLRDSEMTANVAGNNGGCGCGGAIATSGTTQLTNVRIAHNDASVFGGGIGFIGGTLEVRKSTLHKNTAPAGGGIMIDQGESVSISRSTISANIASNNGPSLAAGGGGILISSAIEIPTVSVTNVTISGNKSNVYGGGIHFREGKLKVNASTITKNTADLDGDHGGMTGGSGGGVYSDGQLKIRNSIVAGNSATNGADRDCRGGAVLDHSLIGKKGECGKGAGSIVGAPPQLGPLADNGGPTETHALKPGSAAIGLAGASAPARDQRGVNRDAHPDAGAYER